MCTIVALDDRGEQMALRWALFACGCFLSSYTVQASSFVPMPVEQAARLFGQRPSAFGVDLSPDGDKLVYLASGPGASTAAHLLDFSKHTDLILAQSNGKPR